MDFHKEYNTSYTRFPLNQEIHVCQHFWCMNIEILNLSMSIYHLYMLWWPYYTLQRYWMGLFVNELKASYCNRLEKYKAFSSYLDSTLHMFTPNPIYSIAAPITLVLIILLLSNISSSWYGTSDYIWTGGISDMGNLSSMMTQSKITDTVMIQNLLLFDFLENIALVPQWNFE